MIKYIINCNLWKGCISVKYKLLLAGKNQVIVDDFFYAMHEDFECMTTSIRGSDVVNHIRYFQPDAFVYCITPESRETINKLITALDTIERKKLNLILIGDSDTCEEFTLMKPELVSLTLLKPITASAARQQIIKFLREQRELAEAEAAMEKKAAEEAQQAADASEEAEPKHILVIDDDPIMLRLIKTELKDHYNVATAISGKIALNFLQKKKTDLILLDYEMPEENGPEVLEKIRKSDELKDIPVVFLTGINEKEKIQMVLSMNPQGYLLKPIEHDKLVQTIQRIIG